jgi:salicylate hydroxylase
MNIAIAGCGPAGLASALFLKRDGHIVTLFDQFDTPRPMGSGLLIQPSGQQVLAELELLDKIRALAAPVTHLSGVNVANGKRALEMEYRHLGQGVCALGIHRASLFETLFDAVTAEGVRIETGSKLVSTDARSNYVEPQFENGGSMGRFDLLIDATGAHGPLAQGNLTQLPFAALWTTIDRPANSEIGAHALDQRYWAASKMAGIMPVGVNPATGNSGAALFWSIKPGDLAALRSRGIEAWRAEFFALWPEAEAFAAQIRSMDDFTQAIYTHRTGAPSTHQRIFHMGDSWHCTSPQLGQGANMALIDAAAIVEAISQSNDPDTIARRYRHLRSDHVKLYQMLSYVFTPLYQSDSALLPVLRDLVIHYTARKPLIRSLITQVVSGNFGKFS